MGGPQAVQDDTNGAEVINRGGTPAPARPEEALLDSVVAISSNLDVRTVLTRLLTSASRVTTAEFGELVITGAGGEVVEVITDARSQPRAELGDDGSFLQVPVRLRGTIVGRMELARRAPFTEQERALVEGLGSAAGFAIDNARSYEHNERRRQWLEASAWLSEALRPPIDIDVARRRITDVARSISGAASTAFIQWPHDRSPVVIRTDNDGREALDGLLDSVASTAVLPADRYDVLHIGVGDCRAIVLPLRAHIAAPTALVVVFDGSDHLPGPDETALLESLADQAALALDRVQAVADRVDLEVVSQRDRVSRELHDVVIQRLFATALQLQGMRATVEDPATRERIDGAIDGLDLTIRDIRGAIFDAERPREDEVPGATS